MPKTGPRSETGASVTEIEYLEARKLQIPIFPFIKNLSYDADRTSPEAQKRDGFRNRVMDWEAGRFVAKFDRAFDLAEKVAKALIDVITDVYVKSIVQARIAMTKEDVLTAKPAATCARPPWIPDGLIKAVSERRAVLFAGAGMSTPAGLPTATAFAEYLHESLRVISPDYIGTAASFVAVASDFAALTSREHLRDKMREFLEPPQGLHQTRAHRVAVKVFDQIFTTNFDKLFEQALQTVGDNRPVVTGDIVEQLASRVLVKLHGSFDVVPSVLVTDADISRMEYSRKHLWSHLRQVLQGTTVVVAGMSLRDLSIVKLFEESMPLCGGYFITPDMDAATRARVARWNLQGVQGTADEVFGAIADSVGNAQPAT